jgi:DNA-binding response OmpR family regulator
MSIPEALMSDKILFVSDDVFFWARVHGIAKSLGRDAIRVGDEATMETAFQAGGVSRVIVDLGARSVDALAWAARWRATTPRPQLVAFGSHVNEARFAEAREAGFDEVMANSRFSRSIADWLS